RRSRPAVRLGELRLEPRRGPMDRALRDAFTGKGELMRAVICWAGISGYIAACWRALAVRGDVDLLVIAFGEDGSETAFSTAELVRGINCRLLNSSERHDADLIARLVAAHQPQVLSAPGWFHPPYKSLVGRPELSGAAKVMV